VAQVLMRTLTGTGHLQCRRLLPRRWQGLFTFTKRSIWAVESKRHERKLTPRNLREPRRNSHRRSPKDGLLRARISL